MNYCWTHGGDVHHEHTSAMCGNPDEGHQWYATRDNILGGAAENMHKVWQGWRLGEICSNVNENYSYNTVSDPTSNNNNNPITISGIPDSGATGHFLLVNSECINKQLAKNPISVQMPDDRKTFSTHTCDLDIDDLPAAAKKGHILPGLASHALISVRVLCDHGCTVTF